MSNLTRIKNPAKEGLVRFQWNPDSQTGLVWLPMNLPLWAEWDVGSGTLAVINKWKWVWISQLSRNFLSPVFHTRKQSSVRTL